MVEEVQPVAPVEEKVSLFKNKKTLGGIVTLFIFAVILIVALIIGRQYDLASIEKSSLFIPFLFRKKY